MRSIKARLPMLATFDTDSERIARVCASLIRHHVASLCPPEQRLTLAELQLKMLAHDMPHLLELRAALKCSGAVALRFPSWLRHLTLALRSRAVQSSKDVEASFASITGAAVDGAGFVENQVAFAAAAPRHVPVARVQV